MLTLIGNSPSSGSTYLADLLDSTPVGVCGPELGLYSGSRFYDFEAFKQKPFLGSPVCSPYSINGGVNPHMLPYYGLDKKLFSSLVDKSSSLMEFQKKLEAYVFSLRGKPETGVFFEKTPQNISTIDLFFEAFPASYFIFVVRNPADVISSMLRRGFSAYVAASTWLVEVAKYWRFREDPRVITIRYEDLLSAPFAVVNAILKRLGFSEYPQVKLQGAYENNTYRKKAEPRLKSWGHSHYAGKSLQQVKQPPDGAAKIAISALMHAKVSDAYAELFDLSVIQGEEAISFFGYSLQSSAGMHDLSCLRKAFANKSHSHFFKKFLYDWRYGQAKFSSMRSCLSPIEIAKK